MPLHKTSRGSRLDPTMISAPLGDFRHTMHIGRGGDVFGDTSFLSTHGPSTPSKDSVADAVSSIDSEPTLKSGATDMAVPQPSKLQHSESVSSLSLDLDLDLGPSILGDVLGVMDGLGLDSAWTMANEEGMCSPRKGVVGGELGICEKELLVCVQNEVNERAEALEEEKVDAQVSEESSLKLKGGSLRPKVRFSDKRDEIIGREEEGDGLEQDGDELECVSPREAEHDDQNFDGRNPHGRWEAESTNHMAAFPPSPASSHSSEYEGVTPLDQRRDDNHLSESESEEAGATEQGYTFEDEFEDEIGL
ncbi:cdc42 effector protein 5 [Scleropages formosus]|uniref:cdc42 effector protein 5 n=1 Tax=Scleropages formosus TaxID=113540 RepID=UPI0008781264|nr:cdc42 effector protein 5 [Scleropages formosus]